MIARWVSLEALRRYSRFCEYLLAKRAADFKRLRQDVWYGDLEL